jgi:large subunit ribosomal protein L10
MLSKSVKQARVTDLHKKMEKAVTAIVASPKSIDVATSTAMRKKMRGQAVEFKVVKNTLARIAAKGTSLETIIDLFEGQTAIIFGYTDVVAPAKAVAEFQKEKPDKLEVRGGVVEGKKLDAKGVEALSKMPGLPEARGMVVSAIAAPAQRLASMLTWPGGQLVAALKARVEQLEKEAPAKA